MSTNGEVAQILQEIRDIQAASAREAAADRKQFAEYRKQAAADRRLMLAAMREAALDRKQAERDRKTLEQLTKGVIRV